MTTEFVPKRTEDQRVRLHGVGWDHFELILAIRGEDPTVRLTYLGGELEFMSPSPDHEWLKTVLARLIEAYAQEKGLILDGYGSWTLRKAIKAAGAEPDECYILGGVRKPAPDMALEVIWSSGGLDKLEVYARLGIPEIWFWEEGQLLIYLLGSKGYARSRRSRLLPELDVKKMVSFVDRPSQTQAVGDFLQWLRGRSPSRKK